MSTVYKNITAQRFLQLARLGETLFHVSDLANLWKIKDKNTLHTLLKRYTQAGLLFRIYRGFYSIKPLSQIDLFLLGVKALNRFAYISAETILVKEGIISQFSPYITLVSSVSKKFSLGGRQYFCRQLNDRYLYNKTGLYLTNGYYQATLERAVADLLYFNPHYYLDGFSLLDWKKIKKIQKEIGYI